MGSIEGVGIGVQLAGESGKDPRIRRAKPSGYNYQRQQILRSKRKHREDRDLTPPLLGLAVGDFLAALISVCEQITRKFQSKFETSEEMNTELALFLLTMTSLYFRESLPNGTQDYRDVLDERISNALTLGSKEILSKILMSRLPGSINSIVSLSADTHLDNVKDSGKLPEDSPKISKKQKSDKKKNDICD